MNRARRLIHAPLVADAESVLSMPGAVLLEHDRIVAAGSPESIGQPEDAEVTVLENEAVLPGLVNAHTHLDLSHIGPVPFGGSFTGWIELVRQRRAVEATAIAAATDHGIALALAGGCAAVGDVAGVGSTVPLARLRAAAIGGVSFLECFGLGSKQERTVEFLQQAVGSIPLDRDGVRLGLQPHSPYSCGPAVFAAAARLAAAHNLPICTHLAETLEELEFVRAGTGPLAEMLRGFGAWEPGVGGQGDHPVAILAEVLAAIPFLLAHVNYAGPREFATLAACGARVVYCPRASAYFGHAGHPYRELLAAGIEVALGTDSLLCLDTPDRLGTLDEMRFLHRRDGTDPRLLLRMATTAGARALGLAADSFTLRPGRPAGVLAVPIANPAESPHATLAAVLRGDRPPRWVLPPGRPACLPDQAAVVPDGFTA
ncbi:MAG: amidohydrolase family protein [Phycisphaerales bacterium]|nr:amidohydrolase family protein [Phycisphaerales bacterium]